MTEGGEGGAGLAVLTGVEDPGRHLTVEAGLPHSHPRRGGGDGGCWHESWVRGLQDGGCGASRGPGHLPATTTTLSWVSEDGALLRKG